MQFQAQAWAPGKKFRGAKLTAKRENINEHCQTYFIFGI